MQTVRSRCASLIFGAVLLSLGAASEADVETSAPPSVEFGPHPRTDGWVDFGLRAPAADTAELLIYDAADATTPAKVVPMTRDGAGDWGVRVRGPGVGAGTFYMYRLNGHSTATTSAPFGTVLNGNFVLNDPYAYRTEEVGYSKFYLSPPFVDSDHSIYAGGGKSIIYDHGADSAPSHVDVRPEDLIVYELHVQDYTAQLQGLPPGLRGTYLGLAQGGLKTPAGLAAGIDHLAELGVTAVELMPVMQYDKETTTAPGRVNHWGYMTTNFFAPETRYASRPGDEVIELKRLVQAFHGRGIAVFMDAVYNHTAEGDWVQDGRLADKCYNLCDDIPEIYGGTGNGFFANASGTGNDVDYSDGDRFTKHLVLDSLALWHNAYGVDGFRFDLARILADGSTDAAAWVNADPRFGRAHLHAEPWDTQGQWWNFMDSPPWDWTNNRWAKWIGKYRDGARLFDWTNNRWAKWIGKYRDGARLFSKSELRDPGMLKRLIEGRGAVPGTDAAASSKPWRSINFIAVHDGYTLRDCMFFNDSDGSQNCWDSSGDEDLRRRREKLLLGLLLTSNGVPLLQQGDEFGRTKSGAGQDGAKNSWDWESISADAGVNGVNWIDWALKDDNPGGSPNGPRYGRELSEWTRGVIAMRRRWTQFRQADFAEYAAAPRAAPGDPANDGRLSYSWQGPPAGSPSQLAVIRWGRPGEPDLMVIYNENWNSLSITNLGDWSRRPWKVLARSWLPRGDDLCALTDWTACPDAGPTFTVDGRALAILAASRD